MRVINPDYIKPETTQEAAMSAQEASLRAWFAANTGTESATFDQVRAKYSKTKTQWPDGLIHQKLKDWGFTVVDS